MMHPNVHHWTIMIVNKWELSKQLPKESGRGSVIIHPQDGPLCRNNEDIFISGYAHKSTQNEKSNTQYERIPYIREKHKWKWLERHTAKC